MDSRVLKDIKTLSGSTQLLMNTPRGRGRNFFLLPSAFPSFLFDLSSFSFSSSPLTPPHPSPQNPACCLPSPLPGSLYLLTQGFTSSQKEFLTNSGDRLASERSQHQKESQDRARGVTFLSLSWEAGLYLYPVGKAMRYHVKNTGFKSERLNLSIY